MDPRAAVVLALVLLLAAATRAQDTRPATRRAHPLDLDATGIRWVHPFQTALAKAKKEKRLLLFLPLAGGSNHKGDW